ncbi:sodium ion-translocating decarboxylase subunit beta [Ruminococcaceae bacterium OttesenSCG-928-I18]|nr:sodium ion-translocating decarboxylase subunit beta [Ruminococcaceae bacterium OttesenSCG-928-I18]
MSEFLDTVVSIWRNSGFVGIVENPLYLVMIAVACLLLYLAIVREFEPLLLLPIAFGMLLANLPFGEIIHMEYFIDITGTQDPSLYPMFSEILHHGGLADMLYLGVKLGIYPPLIFLGIGTMTDFGPLIANPKSLLLGAAAQFGIFVAFIGATALGFTGAEAGSIGIIGGADGPTAIYVTSKLAPHLLGSVAVAAYSYMALVPIIQPPFMRLLTTKKERGVVMKQLRPVSRTERIIFPIVTTIIVCLILPSATPLIGMLMLGNLMRESGVVERISKTAGNELMNIITIFLGVSVGCTTNADTFLTWDTIKIVILGLIAFIFGTVGGLLLGKLMYLLSKGQINPLIGSAGVSAVPMAARVSQKVGAQENPSNFLLMHAMGPNVAGVIGSAVAAGILINIFS